ncbi:MAG: hypothetical protein MJ218_02010 [Opitutales bacterium]|nr:hypothetical protein [Opitutales bacterium]
MTKRVSLLLALSIALGIHTPCYGLYVMVRSGFGELKADKQIGTFRQTNGTLPTWHEAAVGANDNNLHFDDFPSSSLVRSSNCTSGKLEYKNHHNLSVALGGRFDVFDIGALGIELEILGGYANFKNKTRDFVDCRKEFNQPQNLDWNDLLVMRRPDFLMIKYQKIGVMNLAQIRPMYLSNQRIAGVQANFYWEQYILDWLSAGIGGGIGGAYIATKMKTYETWRRLWIYRDRRVPPGNHYCWDAVFGLDWKQRTKYAHNLALLYNLTLFVRAEKFETLFEVGFRHIGLHEVNDNKIYGHSIKNLANLHSDQIYLGVGRTF